MCYESISLIYKTVIVENCWPRNTKLKNRHEIYVFFNKCVNILITCFRIIINPFHTIFYDN